MADSFLEICVSHSDPVHPAPEGQVEFRISPAGIAQLLLCVAILLTALSLTGQTLQPTALGKLLLRLFDVDREGNISTFYSALLLTACSFLLYTMYKFSRTSKDRYSIYWICLAIIFACLAVDEAAALHELVSRVLHRYLLTLETGFASLFVPTAWVLPAGFAVLVVGSLYLRFLFALPRRSAWLFASAGLVYLSGALLFEMLAWHYLFWVAGMDYVRHSSDVEYVLLTSVEELLEMGGAVLFIYGLLSHMAREVPVATIRVASEPKTEPAPRRRAGRQPCGPGARSAGDEPSRLAGQYTTAGSRRSFWDRLRHSS
jgi:hypothetical protein